MGDKRYILAKLLSGNRIALAFFNLEYESDYLNTMEISFCDLGIHSGTGIKMKFTNFILFTALGSAIWMAILVFLILYRTK